MELSEDQIRRFDDWPRAKEFLVSLEGQCVFRGAANAGWDLETSLDRCARYHYAEAEKLLIESFERSLRTPLQTPPPKADRVSWMALMRHYGLPSRLLDCTENLLVAAYFAVAGKPKSDFAIWAFDSESVQRSAEQSIGILKAAGNPLSRLELGWDPIFTSAFGNTTRFVALVDATHKTERQQKQSGLFLCPGSSELPFWRNLSSRAQINLCQVVVPCGAQEQVMAELEGQDINQEQLLPDPNQLGKLCTALSAALTSSQDKYGHFQWRVQVLPQISGRGLSAEIVET